MGHEPSVLTNETIRECVSRHEPTVFPGAAKSWLPKNAGHGLSILDWLTEGAGDRVVPFNIGLPGDSGFFGTAGFDGGAPRATTAIGHRSIRDVAQAIRREVEQPTCHRVYIQSLQLDTMLPGVIERADLPQMPAEWQGKWHAWIGSGDHTCYHHIDGTENIFGVLAGTKVFHLVPFDSLPDIYVGPLEGGAFCSPASVVNPLQPDLTSFPRFRNVLAKTEVVTLSAGDVLYLPSCWWHSVESNGFNVSFNYWWNDVHQKSMAAAESVFLRALLEWRDLPAHWRAFWLTMLETFVFRLHGDPFAHLPPDAQGFAGVRTPERAMYIRAKLLEGK